jgi:hypothetical protein
VQQHYVEYIFLHVDSGSNLLQTDDRKYRRQKLEYTSLTTEIQGEATEHTLFTGVNEQMLWGMNQRHILKGKTGVSPTLRRVLGTQCQDIILQMSIPHTLVDQNFCDTSNNRASS